METRIYPGERIDDLQRDGYRIIQNPKKFCFGMDAVLLSAFVGIRAGERVLDLGSGTGILPILLAAKSPGDAVFEGLEIQPDMAEMAARSVEMNGLGGRIAIREGDLCHASEIYGRAVFDAVVCNPPYMNENHGLRNPGDAKAIARHEIRCTLEDVVREAALVLKPGGRLCMVHRPRRLAEIFAGLAAHRLEPKRLRLVHPFAGEAAKLVLIEAVRGGKPWLSAEPPLIIYREPGVYTDEAEKIYGFRETETVGEKK